MTQGLYSPDEFRDNCGFGLIAHTSGEASHRLLQTAILVLWTFSGLRIGHLLVHSAKLDGWLTVGFLMSTEQPEKLESMWMQPSEAPQENAPALGSWQTFDELVERIREASGVPGIVAARLEDDRVVAIAAGGLRCVDDSTPVTTNDMFHWGSVTKSVTASMVARLVEEGVLEWDGRLGDLLSDMEMRDDYRDVTIEQLLQHRGGFPAYTMFSEAEEDRWGQLSGTPTQQRATFVAHVLSEAPVGTPGESWAYSNAGYAVVALVAERATGESYEDLMRSRVLVPLEMNGTGFGYASIARHACGHEGSGPEAKVVASPVELGAFLAPAGDLHGTAGDLARFVLAHARGLDGHGEWLDPSRIERLHTPLVEWTPPSEYAAGWLIETSQDGANLHMHAGSAGLYFAYVELETDTSRGMVVLMNSGALTHQTWASELVAAWREAGLD